MSFKNIRDVWRAIDQGEEIFWCNDSYHITVEPARPNNPRYTYRKGKVLRVTCISNYFGSLLSKEELPRLYTKGKRL